MNILIICNCASGLEVFRGMLIRELVKEGNTISAIVPLVDNEKEWTSEKQIEEMDCRLIRIPMERRGMNPIRDLKLMIAYVCAIKQERPDLVITYTIKPNAYGGISCRLCHVPYAANITGLGTAFQNEGMLRRFVTILYRVALKKAKVVFFENGENLQIFLNAGIVRNEQTCLLNGAGVDLERFSYKPYPDDDGITRFLFIGRVMKEKGVDELFAAMRMLQKDGIPCSVDVLGGFDEDYSKQIEDCENEGWLRYHGVQSDVRPFIKNCHCFVLPSWHEGMANTNLESAASGRPVITSNIPGCMEAVVDGKTGYLAERKNADDLYKVMKKFAQLPYEERKAMGLAGRKRMEELFDKRAIVAETIRHL